MMTSLEEIDIVFLFSLKWLLDVKHSLEIKL